MRFSSRHQGQQEGLHIIKHRISAFYGTELELILRTRGVL
jgi:nicotinamidase-related amidase